MNPMKKFLTTLLILLILSFSITGCQSSASTSGSDAQSVEAFETTSSAESSGDSSTEATGNSSETVNWDDLTNSDITVEYSKKDLDSSYSVSDATSITLSGETAVVKGDGAEVESSTITITAAGTYIVSGTLTNGQIIVNAGEEDDVQIVLNEATIHHDRSSALYVISADKVILTLADDTTNTLTDGENYTFSEGEDEPDATIFSKQDLTINGTGTLNVEGNYNHGIDTKDNLVIAQATVNVEAVNDAIRGKDGVAIHSGTINLTSGGDAIQSYHETNLEKGYVVIDGGNITISAGDDAIHAETHLIIHDGSITINESYEGLEARMILITGGDTQLNASDDGINAAGSVSTTATTTTTTTAAAAGENAQQGRMGMGLEAGGNYEFKQTGGTLYLNADGDGLDSNGVFYIEGGTVIVDGPVMNGNGALDYTGTGSVSGGTLIAAGSSGMAQAPSEDSENNALMIYFTAVQSAKTTVTLKDSSGNTVMEHTPAKEFQTIVFSNDDLKLDETYSIYVGGKLTTTLTLSSKIMTVSETGETVTGQFGGMNGGMKGGQMPSGEAPSGERPTGERPSGEPPTRP